MKTFKLNFLPAEISAKDFFYFTHSSPQLMDKKEVQLCPYEDLNFKPPLACSLKCYNNGFTTMEAFLW
jgi:hypothetical protein